MRRANQIPGGAKQTLGGAKAHSGPPLYETLIEQAKEVIQQARQEINITEVSLVTMSTKSPCSKCREELKKFLTQWEDKLKSKVKFTLRLSELYHESSETSERAQSKLITWKNELQELGVDFTLEPISVTTELSKHKTRKAVCEECDKNGKRKECEKCSELTDKQRNDCFTRRKKDDETIAKQIKNINTQPTITEFFKPQTLNKTDLKPHP